MIRLCDARQAMLEMDDESVDMIFTDPPYRGISGGVVGGPVGVLKNNDGKIFEHNDVQIEQWAGHVHRVLKSPGHCYVMVNTLNLFNYHRVLTGVGFQLHNLLVWRKNTVNPNRWFMKNAEYILFLRKGPARAIHTPSEKTVIDARNLTGSEKTHPTEKPVTLIRKLILASSMPGDLVFDPFCGTASTGVAAQQEGRRFLGFEIDPLYFTLGMQRLA